MSPPERTRSLDELFDALTAFVRRSREAVAGLGGGLSVVEFTILAQIDARPGTRAADLAVLFGLDKSTVSRQVNALIATGQIARRADPTGRRGLVLEVTPTGGVALDQAKRTFRSALEAWTTSWRDREIATLAELLSQLNATVGAGELPSATAAPERALARGAEEAPKTERKRP